MKLLQIGASWLSYQFSGLERYYAELVARLPGLGAQVTGLVYELKESPAVPGLDLVSFGKQNKNVARQFFDQRRIVKQCLRQGVDLVVSHCTPSLFPSLKHLGDTPLVCHFHGPRYLERIVEGANPISVRLSKYIEHRVYARAQHAIVLSHYMKRVLMETYGFSEEKISVIPGGVNLEQFQGAISRREARSASGLSTDRPILLTVRRLERRMGLMNLVDAMGEVVRDYPAALLLIVGKGTLRMELEHYISSKNLSANVRTMGAVTDHELPLLYKAADFSVVPTLQYEGFGLILVESLAAGTPALGTPVGAIPEVLGPLSASLILPGAASRHLADGIREVLAGKRRLPTAAECESYAAENYAWPIIAAKVNSVYRSILEVSRAPRTD
jgi:glycosyltransferase involved in cell wall biosynthesis